MRFQVLDSWRGVAALLVALFHFRFLGHFYESPFVRHGWLWVDFFFVLSGFVITHAYANRLRAPGGVWSFAVRRFGRLWPLHIAVLAAFAGLELVKWGLTLSGVLAESVPAFAAGEQYSLASLATNALLIHSLGVHEMLTWNKPSWSISTELYVCVAFALAYRLPRQWFRLLALLGIAGGFFAVAQSGSYLNTTYDFGFFRCALGFLLGHFVYAVFGALRSARFRGSTAVEAGAVAGVVLFIAWLGVGATTLAAPLVFSAVVLVFALEDGRISRFLSMKPFLKLGEWSYSIYMVHMLVFVMVSRGLLAIERVTGLTLRTTHRYAGESAPVEVFFFRTNSPWTLAPRCT